MTPAEFQANRGSELKTFLFSPLGTEFINVLNALRPILQDNFPTEHAMTRAYAKVEGYESCLRNIVALTMIPKPVTQPEANYGIEDKK